MSAFFIATGTVKNPEKFQEYAVKSKSTFDEFNAEIILKGKFSGVFIDDLEKEVTAENNHQAASIIKFADMATLENWYQSPSYQALITLRDEAADMTISKYAVPQA